MAYWIFKSEPGHYSWDDLVRDGYTGWDGVRNHQASNNMKAMKVGDRGFLYHSVDAKEVVGVVEVAKTYHPDPTDPTGRWGQVGLKPVAPVATRITLADIKADPALSDLALVRQSRLSVVPVSDVHWSHLCRMTGVSP